MATIDEQVHSAAQLIDQLKSYLLLRRKYLTIDTSERVSKVLSWLLLTLILIGVGMLVLALLLLTLIHVIGDLLGSMTIAYAIATVICILLLLFVWFRRETLIVQPIRRQIDGFLKAEEPEASDSQADPDDSPTTAQLLAELPDSKSELRLAIKLKEKEIKENYNTLFETKQKKNPTLGERVGSIVDRGAAVYRGASIAFGLVNLFRGKKKKKRK